MIACNKKKEQDNSPKYNSYLLVGTYTSGTSKGINIFCFDTNTGDSEFIGETEIFNPSYLAVSHDEKFVYAISEGDSSTSRITAYDFDKTIGSLNLINEQKGGNGPCFVTVNRNNNLLVTADYGEGSVSYMNITADSGKLDIPIINKFEGKSVHPTRQTQSHVHHAIFSPDEHFLFVNDLGTDKIYRYQIKQESKTHALALSEPTYFKVKDGSGPRHTTFHPNGKFAYLITEMSGEVIAYSYDAENGILNEIQSVKADTLNAQGSADIHITPNGKYLYASNRLKGDGLAIFSINPNTGLLTKVGYQKTDLHPRNFIITQNSKFLLAANRDSNNIQIFEIGEGGLLTNIDKDIKVSMPVCLKLTSIK